MTVGRRHDESPGTPTGLWISGDADSAVQVSAREMLFFV
jgi:hypothetical protein